MYLGFSSCPLSPSPVSLGISANVTTSQEAFRWLTGLYWKRWPTCVVRYPRSQPLLLTGSRIAQPWPGVSMSEEAWKQLAPALQGTPKPLTLRKKMAMGGMQGWWGKAWLFEGVMKRKGCQEATGQKAVTADLERSANPWAAWGPERVKFFHEIMQQVSVKSRIRTWVSLTLTAGGE